MTKAATLLRVIPRKQFSKSLHDHYTHRDAVGLRASAPDIIKMKIHSSCEIEYFVESLLCKLCESLGSRYYGIMHVVAEAGSVPACWLLRREYAADIWSSLCWPWMLGSVETSRNALKTSLRGQTRGSVCVGSG